MRDNFGRLRGKMRLPGAPEALQAAMRISGYEDGANEPMCTSTTCTSPPAKIFAMVDGGENENNLPGIGKWLRKTKLAAPQPSPRLQFQRSVKAFLLQTRQGNRRNRPKMLPRLHLHRLHWSILCKRGEIDSA